MTQYDISTIERQASELRAKYIAGAIRGFFASLRGTAPVAGRTA